MYQLFVERKGAYSPDLIGEFEELEEAREKALKEKAADESIRYTIEEATGGVDNYGNLMTEVVEKG